MQATKLPYQQPSAGRASIPPRAAALMIALHAPHGTAGRNQLHVLPMLRGGHDKSRGHHKVYHSQELKEQPIGEQALRPPQTPSCCCLSVSTCLPGMHACCALG